MLEVFEKYVQLLKKEQKQSLKFYTSPEYKELNNKVRSGHMMSKDLKYHYDNIMDAFDGGPTVNSVMTVYRGMTKRYTVFENKGIISTSLSKQTAKTFHKGSSCCLYVITLTPGEYTILPLGSVSEMPEEEEILLPPGTLNIQKITPYIYNEESVDLVYCTYLPENSKMIDTNELQKFNEKQFDKLKIELSVESWIDRIIESNIKEEIKLLCDEDGILDENCVKEQLETLDFYQDVPQEAIDKCLLLLNNISENL